MKEITYKSSTVDSILRTAAQTTRTDKEIKDAECEAQRIVIDSAKKVFKNEPEIVAIIRTAIMEYEHSFETLLGNSGEEKDNDYRSR